MILALRHFVLVSVALLFVMNSPAADKLLYEFQTATNTAAWQIVNDDVMAGVSASTFRLTNGLALFRWLSDFRQAGRAVSPRSGVA